MRASGIRHLDPRSPNLDAALAVDEVAKELRGVTVLKAAQSAREHGVEGIGDHRQRDVEVDLGEDRRRQGVEVEEFDRLRDAVLDTPAPRVVADEHLDRRREVVADEERRLLVAVAADDDLPQRALVVLQGDRGLVDLGVRELPLVVRDVDPRPPVELLDALEQAGAAAPEGDEPDARSIQLGELRVGGEPGVEHQGRGHAPTDASPEREELGHLVLGLGSLDVSGGVEEELGVGVLREERQDALHDLAAGAGPVPLEDGVVPGVRDRVEVEVDHAALVEPELRGPFHEGGLQPLDVDRIQAVGVGRARGALRQDVQPGEQAEARIEGVVPHVGVPLGAEQLEGEEGEQVVAGGDDLAAWEARFSGDIQDPELRQERREQEDTRGGRFELLAVQGSHGDGPRRLRHRRALHGQADLQAEASGEFGEALFGEDPLDGAHADLGALLAEEVGDLAGGQALATPRADFRTDR